MMMDIYGDQAIRREVGADERLLWNGMPRQGIHFRSSDIFAVPFSLLWGGFAFFWEGSVINTRAPLFMRLWGVPFVLAGIYLIAGRFFADSYMRGRTYYGVTDKRVLIIGGFLSREVKSLPLKTMGEISFAEREDGSGVISLGPGSAQPRAQWNAAFFGNGQYVPALDLGGEARSVYDILQNAQKKLLA